MAERGRPRTFEAQAVLEAAMRVFWTKGYEATSIADLTAAMGIRSPSLYAAFGSKEALFRKALSHFEATDGARLAAAVAAAPTAREAIASFLFTSAEAFSTPGRPPGCMVTLSAVSAVGTSDDTCRELRQRRAASIRMFVARLARGQAEGDVAQRADIDAVADFYVTVQQGMSIQSRDGASRTRLDGIAASAMAAWDALTVASVSSAGEGGRPGPDR